MRTYTVRSLSTDLDRLISRSFPVVLVEGEVGQLQTPSSGHCYLMLREQDATLSGVMWRSAWVNQRYRPKPGERVLCRGRLGIYPGQSRYQLYINGIRPAGLGALAKEIEARRARLEAEGLLDPRRKRALPVFPRVIGVATSLTGAALQDFLEVSGRRYPAARVLVAGCVVQGEQAPASVIRAVELLLEHGGAEVIVVTRGGGSKEDLLAFQDEQLARYLAHCPVPVVSAVGHQVDTSLADLVADVVAPTPSAAAMAVTPDGPALSQRVDETEAALRAAMIRELRRRRERVQALRGRLRHPGDRLALARRHHHDLTRRLEVAISRQLEAGTRRVVALQGRLDALSPYAVLGRGYALVSGPQGVVRRADQLDAGDQIEVRVAQGQFSALVR